MTQNADYKYDVYISYPRNQDNETWVNKYFLDKFRFFLTEELGYQASIFIDAHISVGDIWPESIRLALSQSKILVPILSISYFNSPWCMAEFSVMSYREKRLRYRTPSNPNGLLYPIRLFGNGKMYPPFAQKIQSLDCTDFNIIFDGYKETPQYFELLRAIKHWTPSVAAAIDVAPPWMADWLSKEWLEEPLKMLKENPDFQLPKTNFRLPSLKADSL